MVAYQPVRALKLPQSRLSAPTAPPPLPDFLFTGYTGIAGWVEGMIVLAITGASAWVGIRTGLDRKNSKVLRGVGYTGGVGSVLLGVLYLGGKSGLNQMVGLPAVRVSPD